MMNKAFNKFCKSISKYIFKTYNKLRINKINKVYKKKDALDNFEKTLKKYNTTLPQNHVSIAEILRRSIRVNLYITSCHVYYAHDSHTQIIRAMYPTL